MESSNESNMESHYKWRCYMKILKKTFDYKIESFRMFGYSGKYSLRKKLYDKIMKSSDTSTNFCGVIYDYWSRYDEEHNIM